MNTIPTVGLNVLCSGGIHPITHRPCHPAVVAGGIGYLTHWIGTRLSNFPVYSPILIRIPGGWLPTDGPLQRYDQLALGHTAHSFIAELVEWQRLCAHFAARGNKVIFHLGSPRTLSPFNGLKFIELYSELMNFMPCISFDAAANSTNTIDTMFIRERDGVEGWPAPGTDWAFDGSRPIFLQHGNARTILSRPPAHWDNISHVPLSDFNSYNPHPNSRLHIFAEGADEDTLATRDFLLAQSKLGATIYFNPNDTGAKWSLTPAEFVARAITFPGTTP